MTWTEIRRQFPHQWLLVEALQARSERGKRQLERERGSESSLRVLRGGAFSDGPGFVRCAVRDGRVPGARDVDVGFRVVVSPFRSDL